ncbi:MAG: hypothetical protein ABDH20_01440 [Thermus sp.]
MEVRLGEWEGWIPSWALVAYRREEEATPSAVLAWKLDEEGQPVGAYHPQGEALAVFLGALEGERTVEWVHPRLLARGPGLAVWWRPAWPAPMWWTIPELAPLSGKIFPQPPLVFIRRKNQVFTFALEREERPGKDTPLLMAPYPNTNGRGWVCWGSGEKPLEDTPEAWEAAFFASAFTHTTAQPLRRGSLLKLWKGLAGKGHFPTRRLRGAGLTLGEALERTRGRG